MNPNLEEVKEWLHKARNDLLSARILIKHDPPVLDTALFHCQQSVEKLLKGFLAWKSTQFEKVHSLTYLLDLCEVKEPRFVSLRDQIETLAPYAVEVRYPGEVLDITQEEAQEALATVEAIWDFVLSLLPYEIRP